MLRRLLPIFAFVLFPQIASAHLIVDIGVTVSAPAYAARSAALVYTIAVTDYAYDAAFGVVVTDQLAPGVQLSSVSGNGWNCSNSTGTVTCSAESQNPGVSTITINTTAPSSTGSITNSVNVQSIGSIDPNPANDNASAQTVVFDPAACSIPSPSLLGPPDQSTSSDGNVVLAWTAVPAATSYRIWTAVEGALPAVAGQTTATQLVMSAEYGENEWWVEALFGSCPPAGSAHAHFFSNGRPFQFSVADYAGQPSVVGYDDSSLAAAKFVTPSSLGIDIYGNMYVADSGASTIRKIAAGKVTTIAGQAGNAGSNDASGSFALLNHPRALTVSQGGYVYIADTGNQTLRLLYPNGNGIVFGPFLFTIAGTAQQPGTVDGTGKAARFTAPAGIAMLPDYTLFVGDTGNDLIRSVTSAYSVTSIAGTAAVSGSTDGPANTSQFNGPTGIAVDGQGNTYIADTQNDVIRRIGTDGRVSTIAGAPKSAGFSDGSGAAARFNQPTALALDTLGNLYVADTGNHAIRRIAPSHLVTTLIGNGTAGHQNGAGSSAQLNTPTGLAFDSSGNLYIADSGNQVIRIATPGAPPPPPTRRRSVRH